MQANKNKKDSIFTRIKKHLTGRTFLQTLKAQKHIQKNKNKKGNILIRLKNI